MKKDKKVVMVDIEVEMAQETCQLPTAKARGRVR
jgi:hypothetical protein